MVRAVALALTMLAGAPALACSPAFVEPTGIPVQGPNCAYSIDLNQTDSVHLSAVERLGGGLAMQVLSDGNGCYNRQHLLIHDCPSGQVMVIGAENFSLMEAMGQDATDRPGLEVIREAALAASAGGHPMAPGDFARMSQAQGYGAPQILRTTDSLRFDRQTVPLACACRTAGG